MRFLASALMWLALVVVGVYLGYVATMWAVELMTAPVFSSVGVR